MMIPERYPPSGVELPEALQHLLVAHSLAARADNLLCPDEHLRLDDALERAFGADPIPGSVRDAPLLQLERTPVVEVVPDVLLIGEDAVGGATVPLGAGGCPDASPVEFIRDLALALLVHHELPVHPPHGLDLFVGPRYQDHAVGMKALVFAGSEDSETPAGLVDPHPSEAVACDTSLAVPEEDEPALAREHLGGKLAAVFGSHDALDALDEGRDGTRVVRELLGAVFNVDAVASALLFEVGGLVGVLKAPPSADVVDQSGHEVRAPGRHIVDELLHTRSARDLEPAFSRIDVGPNHVHVVRFGVALDLSELVLGRVLLVLGRHANVRRDGHAVASVVRRLGAGVGRDGLSIWRRTHFERSGLGSARRGSRITWP